jgi:tRNA1Val (adenine37-N6)-methyltransferase
MNTSDTRPFHFKQFSLSHHRSTMKVGTDAVLLGIWTKLDGVKEVLDVGTGCGILSLLLTARKASVRVDAVELDEASAREASENFRLSPFAGRLQVFHADINHFVPDAGKKYDLVISNPPFFVNDQRPEKKNRQMARHSDTLSYEQLAKAGERLLKQQGRFAVVLPYRESRLFLKAAVGVGFQLHKQMLIFPKPCKEPNRVNLLLGFSVAVPQTEKFIIRQENGIFTQQYLDMVKNYYLSP